MHPLKLDPNQPSWAGALSALYGRVVTETDVPTWEFYLRKHVPQKGELALAIEYAKGAGLKPDEWCVTVYDLVNWLKKYRAMRATEDRKAETEEKKAYFIAEWKEKIARGCNKDDFLCAVDTLPFHISVRNDITRVVLDG